MASLVMQIVHIVHSLISQLAWKVSQARALRWAAAFPGCMAHSRPLSGIRITFRNINTHSRKRENWKNCTFEPFCIGFCIDNEPSKYDIDVKKQLVTPESAAIRCQTT
jgi:hypothetical protein